MEKKEETSDLSIVTPQSRELEFVLNQKWNLRDHTVTDHERHFHSLIYCYDLIDLRGFTLSTHPVLMKIYL